MKTTMKAPEDTTTSNIDGHEYEVDEDGEIEVRNPNHIETLKMHGYTVVSEEASEEPAEPEKASDEKPKKKDKKKKKDR